MPSSANSTSSAWSAKASRGDRRVILEDGHSHGFWFRTADLILGDGIDDVPGVSAFRRDVAAGKESEFRAVQDRLAAASSTFPGYEGTVLMPPDAGEEWLSMLRFRTSEQLAAWLRSPERDTALPGLRSSLNRGFSAVSQTTPFATTVRVQDGRTLMTPNWKSAMVLLLVLYPTVMVPSRFLGPTLDRAGAEPWLALWVSQIVIVSALQWWLMPTVTRPFRKWLDPVDGAGLRTSLRRVDRGRRLRRDPGGVCDGQVAAVLGLREMSEPEGPIDLPYSAGHPCLRDDSGSPGR